MKIRWFMLILLFLPVSTFAQQVVDIPVDGMVCEFCVYGVKKKLKKLDGVKDVEVSLEAKYARIVMQPQASANIEAIQNAISSAGFTPGNAITTTK